jgi:hypothetical protein
MRIQNAGYAHIPNTLKNEQHVFKLLLISSKLSKDRDSIQKKPRMLKTQANDGYTVPGPLAPRQLAPRTNRPIKTRPTTTRPRDNSPHRQLAPWTTRPMDNSPHGQLAP